MDENNRIYNNDMDLLKQLYPMENAKRATYTSTIFLTLQRNRSVIENMVGGEEERANADLIE